MKNRKNGEESIIELLNNTNKLTQVIQTGIKQVLLKHKQAWNSVCEWINNKVVWISSEKIPVNLKKISRLKDKESYFEKQKNIKK